MKIKHNRVLAEGEVTGHAHRLDEHATVYEDGSRIEFDNAEPTQITHEEHRSFVIPPSPTGRYTVEIVREYDHFLEESRQVRD